MSLVCIVTSIQSNGGSRVIHFFLRLRILGSFVDRLVQKPAMRQCHWFNGIVQWHCPFWQSDVCPSIWVCSNSDKHYAELQMCNAHQLALEGTIKSLQETLDRERVNAQIELQEVTKQILEPVSKMRGYMHVPPGAQPIKVKSGWMNKMVALLGAIQTADSERMELLVAESLSADR